MQQPITDGPIAIIGMGCVFPNAFDIPSYWSALLRRDSSAQRLPPLHRWDYRRYHSEDRNAVDKGYSGLGGYIDGFRFAPARARCTPEEAQGLDEEEQWLLTALAESMEGLRSSGGRLAVFMGGTALVDSYSTHQLQHTYVSELSKLLDEKLGGGDSARAERREWLWSTLRKSLGLVTGGRPVEERMMHRSLEMMVRKMLGARAQPVLLDAACASSLFAIDLGVQALNEGSADVAYCGGYFIWKPLGQVLFCKLGGLSPRGCFPFDARADGTLFGDGAGVVALKRLADAVADGDRVHAVIRGTGTASDGKGKAVYAPNSRGQVRAMHRAFARSALSPETVQYVSAHATGTPLGDATEYKAILQVYGGLGLPRRSVGLGSVKGLFGHLGWTAGVASVIQMALSLKAKRMPPQANFETLSPSIDLDAGPFVIDTEARSWPENRDGLPRRAAVSGFGFGGTDAHLLMEEWRPEDAPAVRVRRGVALGSPSPVAEREERIALVSVGCELPGARSLPEALARVSTRTPAPSFTFEGGYPINNLRYRMIPRAARVTDPLQFMLLDATAQALKPFGEHMSRLGEETDVYIGYLGGLMKCIDQAQRVYWDGVREDMERAAPPAERLAVAAALDEWKARVHDQLPASSEDSFPGIMPNLLSGRISNYYDLQGLNECINAGRDSLAVAFELGMQALRRGQAAMVVVGAASAPGVLLPEARAEATGTPAGEGAVVFCLMRESDAVARSLPVLALLERTREESSLPSAAEKPLFGNLLGATGMVSVLSALAELGGGAGQAWIDLGERRLRLRAVNPVPAAEDEPVMVTQRMLPVYLPQPAYVTEGFDARALRLGSAVVVCSSTDVLRRLRGQFPGARFLVTASEAERAEALALGASWVVESEDGPDARRVVELVPATEALVAVLDLSPYREVAASPRLEAFFWLVFRLMQRWSAQPEERLACAAVVLADVLAAPPVFHPAVGLFTGMMRTLRCELPAARLKALVLDHGRLVALDTRLSTERGDAEVLVLERGGRREVVRYGPEMSPRADQAGEPVLTLDDRSVILAVGGGRGITASVVEALLRRYRCTVVLLGRTEPDPSDPREPMPSRADFIASARARGEDVPVRELNERYGALLAARELRVGLARLEALPGRVEYRLCDVSDARQTRQVISEVLAVHGRVDLVLYGAGTMGLVAPLPALREEGARPVLPGKVTGLINVATALEGQPFGQFFIFGSLASIGLDGMTSYAAANEFQNGFAAWRNAVEGKKRYRSLCWPAWGDAGMVPRTATLRDRLDEEKRITLINTQEGCARLLNELTRRPEDVVYFVGALEVVDRPWQFVESAGSPVSLPADPARDFFYVDDLQRFTPSLLEARRVLDLKRDGYLAQHCVDGEPVLPGTFMLEVAAEAALALMPRLKVAALGDARFLKFIKLAAGRPVPLRIQAERVAAASGRAEVAVTVRSDFISSKGVVLQKDRVHFTCRVLLREELPAAPIPELSGHPGADEKPVPDPYHAAGTPVRLEGVFVTLAERWSSPERARAIYANRVPKGDPSFSRFVLPTLLLDGALRTAALRPVEGSQLPVFAPLGIGRIELYEARNDLAIREAYGTLEVRCAGKKESLSYEVTTPSGALFLRMRGIEAHAMGHVDAVTGEYRAAGELPRESPQPESAPKTVPVEPMSAVRYRTVLQAVVLPATGAEAGKVVEGTRVVTNDPEALETLVGAAPGVEILAFGRAAAQPREGVTVLPEGEALRESLSQRLAAGPARPLVAYFSLAGLGMDPEAVVTRWSGTRSILSALFVLGREVATRGLELGVVCTDAWLPSAAAPHPFASAVRGFLGSLRHEVPQARLRLVVADHVGTAAALKLLAHEGSAPATDFASFHREGVRYVERLEPAPACPAEDGALSPGEVVLMTGGGRGIGPYLARALHERWGCRLVLLGRSAPSAEAGEGPSRAEFIRAELAREPGVPMGSLLARFAKQESARELRRELDQLRASGARLEYYTCDVNDAASVAQAVGRARAAFGRIDVVVHGAAVEHSALMANKRWEEFHRVFDTKVEGFIHLYRALRGELPRVWLNFGSTYSRFGSEGQVDYGAANACLDGFSALFDATLPQSRWATLSWPLWADVGMAARRPEFVDTARERGTHILPATEGARLFLEELAAAPLQAARVVFETGAMVDSNGLHAGTGSPGPEAPLLDTVEHPRAGQVVATRRLELGRDRYLREHLAEGDPSMPGSVELELALELLRHEYPDWKLAFLRQLTQVRFVKVFQAPLTLRMVATRLSVHRERLVVRVELRSDFQHRSGRVLMQDRLHWSCEAELRRTLPPSPERRYAEPVIAQSLPIACYDPASPVYYTPAIRNLVWRKQTAEGRTWGRCVSERGGWEPARRPVIPFQVVDAIGLSPGRVHDGNVEVLMGHCFEEVRFYALAFTPDAPVDLSTCCEPLVEQPDGTFRCASIVVFRGDGQVAAEVVNGQFEVIGSLALSPDGLRREQGPAC